MTNNKKVRTNVKCSFCENGTKPSYKNEEELKQFMFGRKIKPRHETGCCAKHQRLLTREIERARKILLL